MSRSQQDALVKVSTPKAIRVLEDLRDEVASAWSAGQLDAQIVALDALRRHTDALTTRTVAQARKDGLSWSQIAALLGVSKQAAHKRYGVNER